MTKDDFAMLEFAAKAIGRTVVGYKEDDNGNVVLVLDDGSNWQPLLENSITDCMGDALRLANFFRMRIEHHVSYPFVAVFVGHGFGCIKKEEPHSDDVNFATRRAIVGAAAKVGGMAQ